MANFTPIVLDAMATASRIKKNDLLITVSIFFALAIFSTFARITVKVHHHHRFGFDDYFIFFGIVCLTTATGLYFSRVDNFYLAAAIINDSTLVKHIPPIRIQSLEDANVNARIFSAIILAWTATFCAKFSFLAFFRQALARIPKLRVYWISTALVCVGVWIYMIVIPFIACPNLKSDSVKCVAENFEDLFETLTYLGTALDILTDLIITSIPILILRHTTTSLPQRLAISALFSLSVVMVIIAIIRSSDVHGKISQSYDSPWLMLWVHIEAVIAIIMVSLTTFHTIFPSQREERRRREGVKWNPGSWFAFTGGWRNWGLGSGRSDTDYEKDLGLVEVPGRGLTGLRTFIRSNSFGARESIRSTGKEGGSKVRIKETPKKIDLSRAQRWIDGVEEDPWVTSPSWLKLESIEPMGGPRR